MNATTKTITNRALSRILPKVAMTESWTSHLQRLICVFSDPENSYLYMVAVDKGGMPTVRKLTISRDPLHAREQYKRGKALVGQYVKFSVRRGWDGETWFNEVKEATAI
jgi:hypothetical protein